jgi:hypothetical protein
MKTLNDYEKSSALIDIEARMEDFILGLNENHPYGFLPDNLSTLMAKAALNVLETVVDCNIYFEENPITLPA